MVVMTHLFITFFFHSEGLIEAVGHDSEIGSKYKEEQFEKIIDASGQCVLPGLVDAHTHPVWAGDRVHEFSMKVLRNFSF